jgi:hypothetical protein
MWGEGASAAACLGVNSSQLTVNSWLSSWPRIAVISKHCQQEIRVVTSPVLTTLSSLCADSGPRVGHARHPMHVMPMHRMYVLA